MISSFLRIFQGLEELFIVNIDEMQTQNFKNSKLRNKELLKRFIDDNTGSPIGSTWARNCLYSHPCDISLSPEQLSYLGEGHSRDAFRGLDLECIHLGSY
jgi:hypothetical protein